MGWVAHAGIVADLVANIRRTGRVCYAQFPAPVDLHALVRLPGPTHWLKAEQHQGCRLHSCCLRASKLERDLALHRSPRTEDQT